MVIHRSSTGATERTIAHLLESTQGNLKTWLAPTQVRVLSFTDRNEKYARKVIEQLASVPGLRVDADFRAVPVPGKVKDAEVMKIPFIILVGDKEEKNNTLAVRHNGKVEYGVKTGDFAKNIKKLIEEKR